MSEESAPIDWRAKAEAERQLTYRAQEEVFRRYAGRPEPTLDDLPANVENWTDATLARLIATGANRGHFECR